MNSVETFSKTGLKVEEIPKSEVTNLGDPCTSFRLIALPARTVSYGRHYIRYLVIGVEGFWPALDYAQREGIRTRFMHILVTCLVWIPVL